MNLGIASSSGLSQDPLNYLQRSITRSARLSKLGKKHIKLLVRKVKAEGPYSIEEAVARSLWARAYSELIRLQDKLDTLDVMDKAYKPTVWALCKLSEVIVKFKTPKQKTPKRQNGSGSLVQSAPRGRQKADNVASDPDAVAASEANDAG